MKTFNFFIIAMLAAILFSPNAVAQDQNGGLFANTTLGYQNSLSVQSLKILNYVAPGCDNSADFVYSVAFTYHEWGTPSGPEIHTFPSIPGGNGEKSFTVAITYDLRANTYVIRQTPIQWDLFINGVLCEDCMTDLTTLQGIGCGNMATQHITFTHQSGDSWVHQGVADIIIRPKLIATAYQCYYCTSYCPWPLDDECCGSETPDAGWVDYSTTTNGTPMEDQAPELRFRAVLPGVSFTDTIGTFDTPQVLTCILRDPPGDQSYGEWTETTEQCFGTTTYAGTGTESSQWAQAKVGIGGEFLGFEYNVYASGGVSASIENETTIGNEYLTCVETSQTYTTGDNGIADDLFIGSSLKYLYGMARTIFWEDCIAYYSDGFAMRPVSTNSTFALNESAIRNIKIPELEAEIEDLPILSDPWKDKMAQLSAWEQALDMNDQIKEEATGGSTAEFFSTTGAAQTNTITTTTSQTKFIDMKVRLNNGLEWEYGTSIGCCEVSEGGEFNIRTEYGSTATSSNVWTNTMSFKLGDDDDVTPGVTDNLVDQFYVQVMPDRVFGSYVFELLENSITSCPYEGGYQIEQPQLWVGNTGDSTMTIENIPVGESVDFPLIICNNSNRPVDYWLDVNDATNIHSAEIQAFGATLIGNDYDPVNVGAGACVNANLSFTQQSLDDLVHENIEIQLRGCDEPVIINSNVKISAYFGSGVGINEATSASGWFAVSPNPSNGIFRITPKGSGAAMTLFVTDMLGRTVITPVLASGAGNTEIDLGHVSSGMYILVAERDGARQSTRLIVER